MLKYVYIMVIMICLTAMQLGAAESNIITSDTSTARIIINTDSISPAQQFTAALHLDLAVHWHSYWKNPGDSGIPTTMEFNMPEGFEASDIIWQTPSRYELAGIVNYGYADEVYHFVDITAPDTLDAKDVTFKIDASWLVCRDICIPEYADFSITLPTSNVPTASSTLLRKARSKVPSDSTIKGNFSIDDTHVVVTLPKKGDMFPEQENIIANDTLPEIIQQDDLVYYRFKKGYKAADSFNVVVKTENERATLHTLTRVNQLAFPTTDHTQSSSPAPTSLWLVISLAFIGGVILNLMPCVLPILSLKALTLVELSGHSRKQAILHSIAYLAGISLTFTGITLLITLLQQAGMRVGWGFQLQSPVFVGALVLLLAAVGLNLSGIFHLPVLLGGMAQGRSSKSTPTGSFFTGVMAVIIATPCTAPFMAPAIGYALSQSFVVQLFIFLILGFGLALPYLLLGLLPSLQRFLPKPGAWMNTFKHALAFPMYATAAWLLWVLTRQSGTDALAVMLAALLILSFLLWCYGRSMMSYKKWGLLILISLTVAMTFKTLNILGAPTSLSLQTTPYSSEALQQARDNNERVFVYGTADWCITCKINERLVLNDETVITHFSNNDITVLKADWTSYNNEITKYLRSYNRAGVPIYVYYNKKGQDNLLPQILTPQIIIDATGDES